MWRPQYVLCSELLTFESIIRSRDTLETEMSYLAYVMLRTPHIVGPMVFYILKKNISLLFTLGSKTKPTENYWSRLLTMLSYHCDDTSHYCYISTTVQNQPEKKNVGVNSHVLSSNRL